jgi:DNA/RNA-binding domain of Phe-tRNA-synthetase-like protein
VTSGEPPTAPRPVAGFVAPEIGAEFPGLRLDWISVGARPRPSPPAVVARLALLSDRFRGAGAVTLRARPIPQAYRAFFRQIGLDPDVDRIPSERAAVARLLQGGFRSQDAVADACLIALLETGVPVWPLDAGAVDERGLGIGLAGADGPLGGSIPAGDATLAVVDGRRVHAVLFGEASPASVVTAATARVALFSVGVGGVPAIHIEEALWLCAELLGGA